MKFNNKDIVIGKGVLLGKNVRIGDRTIIYDNVIIGDNTTISNDCIIGEPLNDYYYKKDYENPKTIIGANSLIRSHSILYAGSSFGDGLNVGHRVTIREYSIFGENCGIGTLCDIQGYVNVGKYCRLHSNVHIGQKSTIGDFVFIYPYVIFTNDPHPPSDICKGPTVGNYSQIAVSSVLLPGINIGENVLVGAGSIVGKDVEDYSLVVGNPAKIIKDVRELKTKGGESHYPWMHNFDRGMPWKGGSFNEWIKSNK